MTGADTTIVHESVESVNYSTQLSDWCGLGGRAADGLPGLEIRVPHGEERYRQVVPIPPR